MKLPRFAATSQIGYRLAIPIIVFSSVMTLLITVQQLVSDYRQQLDDLESRLDEIQVMLPSFAASVWTFNDRQIRLGLRAVVNLPNMERASIAVTAGDSRWSEGVSGSSHVVTRTYPLIYGGQRKDQQIGTIEITASLDSIYQRLASRVVTLLVSNGVKTFLVAGFMLFVIRRLVTTRLADLEGQMGGLFHQINLAPVTMDMPRDLQASATGDEIDRLAKRFSSLVLQLAEAVRRQQMAEEQLREANAGLSRRIEERTADLTAANLSLIESKKVAENAAEAERQMRLQLRNFLSTVSHEVRVPLSIIGGATELLGFLTSTDEVAQDELGKISRAVRRMSDLLDACLSDEQLDFGEIKFQVADVDIGALVAEVCQEFAVRAPGRVMLLPESSQGIIEADGTLLRIAVSNLLDNALKYSPPASAVAIDVRVEGQGFAVHVRDQGMGIHPDEKDRIFEKYFRSAKADGVWGAGLGLHILKGIIDRHGGTVTVDSRPGKGSTFTLHLPLRQREGAGRC